MKSDTDVEPLVDRALAGERVLARPLGAPGEPIAAAGRPVRKPSVGRAAAGHLKIEATVLVPLVVDPRPFPDAGKIDRCGGGRRYRRWRRWRIEGRRCRPRSLRRRGPRR